MTYKEDDIYRGKKKDKMLYNVILCLHFIYMLFLTIGWLSNDKYILCLLLFLTIITLILYFSLNGCIITKLERRLSNSRYNILKTIYKTLDMKYPSSSSQKKCTILIFSFTIIVTSIKLYLMKTSL